MNAEKKAVPPMQDTSKSPESNFVIAIDGPAGSGKSSVAGLLAKKLGCLHADSGAMYRTLTLAVMQQIGEHKSAEMFGLAFGKALKEGLRPEVLECSARIGTEKNQENFIKGVNVGDAIRSLAVTKRIRYIADERSFRQEVNRMLRSLAKESNLIVDGRDIGSVVFPNTPWKFYLDASPEERARRRLLEYRKKGMEPDITQEELKKQIIERDRQDESRPFGALKKASGAILIDTSSMSRNAVLEHLLTLLQIRF